MGDEEIHDEMVNPQLFKIHHLTTTAGRKPVNLPAGPLSALVGREAEHWDTYQLRSGPVRFLILCTGSGDG